MPTVRYTDYFAPGRPRHELEVRFVDRAGGGFDVTSGGERLGRVEQERGGALWNAFVSEAASHSAEDDIMPLQGSSRTREEAATVLVRYLMIHQDPALARALDGALR